VTDQPLATSPPRRLLERAFWVIVVEALLIVGLILVVAFLLLRAPNRSLEQALLDPELRRTALQELVDQSQGLHDTFPDPDVGRVLVPGRTRRFTDGRRIQTNRYGMRDRDYALPKPKNTRRVVLLGDSFIFGLGLDESDRACVFLEPWLKERALAPGLQIECLQLGVSSWNIKSEATYLRRQVSLLQPDAVVHLVLPNDLGDTSSARGFGVTATYTDQRRERANSIISVDYPQHIGFPKVRIQPLLWGVDAESRARYDEVAEPLLRLGEAVRAQGGRYLLLVKWSDLVGTARDLLIPKLRGTEVRYLPHRFSNARQHIISEQNLHWNRAGNEAVARYLFGWIEGENVLPDLRLGSWPEAGELYQTLKTEGEREARSAPSGEQLAQRAGLLSQIATNGLDLRQATQIYCGIDRQGIASVYASMVLARGSSTRLLVEGRGLGRPEIDGVAVTVWADEEEVGTIAVPWSGAFRFEVALPSSVLRRPYFAVRLLAKDYVYVGPELRDCAALRLERVVALP